MTLIFYLTAAVALLATALAITRQDAVHALLYLVVSLLAVALLLFLLGAPFAAALEVIVYAGAIMVLFLFAVMLLGRGPGHSLGLSGRARGWIGPALLAALLLAELLTLLGGATSAGPATGPVNPRAVGLSLFGPYLLAVELASMLLLAGVVGAWHLGRSLPARQSKQP
jgi:NADH-quinone oxidoreductase subunit J